MIRINHNLAYIIALSKGRDLGNGGGGGGAHVMSPKRECPNLGQVCGKSAQISNHMEIFLTEFESKFQFH